MTWLNIDTQGEVPMVRLATYTSPDGSQTWGFVRDDGVVNGSAVLAAVGAPQAPTIRSLIEVGVPGWPEVLETAARAPVDYALDAVHLRQPLTPPRDVFAVGVNYAAHAMEARRARAVDALPTVPVIFSKAWTSVSGPTDDIQWLPTLTSKLDYEVELAVVIGQAGRHINPDQALAHVFGYMVANDVSARDVQHDRPAGQWFLGKSMDTFCPIGPWIVTADEVGSPQNLDLSLRVNGEIRQQSNTRDMLFSVADLIAEISSYVSLLPGDIIVTGTPSGVGAALNPPQFLTDGDVVEAEISGLGILRNTVVRKDTT